MKKLILIVLTGCAHVRPMPVAAPCPIPAAITVPDLSCLATLPDTAPAGDIQACVTAGFVDVLRAYRQAVAVLQGYR